MSLVPNETFTTNHESPVKYFLAPQIAKRHALQLHKLTEVEEIPMPGSQLTALNSFKSTETSVISTSCSQCILINHSRSVFTRGLPLRTLVGQRSVLDADKCSLRAK